MSPETIIAQLEQINSWRRGEESEPQPDPKHVGEVIDAAVASLRSLIASNTTLRRELREARAEVAQLKGALALGQENCDAEYEELREERDKATARCIEREERIEQMEVSWDKTKSALARVTAERDAAKAEALGNAASYRDADARRAENYRMFTTVQGERDVAKRSIVALRARVDAQYAKGYDDCKREYEEKLVSLSAITAEWRDGCNFQSERAEKTEQRNAELVAALRKLHRVMSAWLECYGHRTGGTAEEWRRKYHEARKHLRDANRGAQRNAMVAELAHARLSRPNEKVSHAE